MKLASRNIKILVLSIGLLVIWALLKWTKFGLGFYFSDLYVHDQLSRLWILGDPLLHDNRFGNHLALHNFFLTPFLAIFTAPLGVPGLFVVHLLIITIGIILYLKHSEPTPFNLLILFGLFLGPFAYWLFDNRPYGWHPELLYFPLSWILATSLKFRQSKSIFFCALAMILLREDGVILFWTIATFYLIEHRKYPLLSKKVILLSLGCLFIFISGLTLLSFSGDGNSRLGEALQHLQSQPSASLLNLLTAFGQFLLISLPFTVLYLTQHAMRKWLILMGVSIPLILAAWISGLHYFPDTYHGMLWQPRIAGLWAVLIAGLVLENQGPFFPKKKWQMMAGILMLWTMQFGLLIGIRNHNLFFMTTDIWKEEAVYSRDPLYGSYKKLALEVEHRKAVAVPYEYFHLFHRHVIIWPDYPEKKLRNPDYILARDIDSLWHRRYYSGYDSLQIQTGLWLKWCKELAPPQSLTK